MISTTEKRTAFDPSSLKVGDEVGITWRALCSQANFVCRVEAIEEGGLIRLEGRELPFWPDDGREMELIWDGVVTPSPNGVRLCAPTDEGRLNSLSEDIWADLETLIDRRSDLSLDEMQRLAAAAKALLAEFPERVAIEVPSEDPIEVSSVETESHTLKLVHGA